MATITRVEVDVRAVLTIKRRADGTIQLWARGISLDIDNKEVRATRDLDITDQVAQGVRDGAESLMTNIEARLRNQWQIG